jgi:hypothetical protein
MLPAAASYGATVTLSGTLSSEIVVASVIGCQQQQDAGNDSSSHDQWWSNCA